MALKTIPGAFVFLTFLSGLFVLSCSGEKQYILVVDTSGSMAVAVDEDGKSAANPENAKSTLERIKTDSREFVNSLENGDQIEILKFDSKPEILSTVVIKSEEDRKKILETIDSLEAKGRHTDMQLMVNMLRDMNLKNTSANQKIIIVLSDGKDDPPASARKKTFDLNVVKKEQNENSESLNQSRYFIYYISLGKIKDPALTGKLEKLTTNKIKVISKTKSKGEQPGVSSNTDTVIESNQNPLVVVQDDVESNNLAKQMKFWGLIVLAVMSALFFILVIMWLFFKLINRIKPAGAFKYYDKMMGEFSAETKSLEKLEKSTFTLGAKTGVDFKIRDLGVKSVPLKSTKKSGNTRLLIKNKNDKNLFEFKKQSMPGYISTGDVFKLGNFIIEYVDGKE